MLKRSVLLIGLGFVAGCATRSPLSGEVRNYAVEDNFKRLLAQEDTDGDMKITVRDQAIPGTKRGNKLFSLRDDKGGELTVKGTYPLSVLLQELSLAREQHRDKITLSVETLTENPVDRTRRLIRDLYWDSLTRQIDRAHLPAILADDKMKTARKFLYVPASDSQAWRYFKDIQKTEPSLHLDVIRLPEKITPAYVRSLDGHHGLLTLALQSTRKGELEGVPFVVPGGRFNEMYGWDSYFIVLGLLTDGRVDLAKSMADNFIYEIRHYGKILNANRSYYLTRSQPPFFSSLIRSVWNTLPHDDAHRDWLKIALESAINEHRYWITEPHLVKRYGLSRYYDLGYGPSPEVERGHYDAILAPYATKAGLKPAQFLEEYSAGKYKEPALDNFFKHDRAIRESGHDTTYRFDNRTSDFLSFDLNALLYKTENDIADILRAEFGGSLVLSNGQTTHTNDWLKKAEARKRAMNHYFWDNERGFFFDYDFARKKRSTYLSATGLYALWAGLATPQQAERIAQTSRQWLEQKAGLAATAEDSRGPLSHTRPARQWDFPYGWAPHQILAWEGLRRYGFETDADRLAYKWIYTLTKNARDYNGTIPEKIDVVTGSHDVFAEYGNVGTDFSYITKEGFGWMNASYELALKQLPPLLTQKLASMISPEEIFTRSK